MSLYVIVYPFTLSHYPAMTDVPFHAACASVIRHFASPAWHFSEQFSIHYLDAPYASMHLIGALFALVMPVAWAAKGMAIVMLALLPGGFAVLLLGMRKSPQWAIATLGLVWCRLTNWGFLSFVGAIGLFAMVVGCALLVLDRPSRLRRAALCLCLTLLLFTHVFRFPFGVAAVLLTGAVMYPAQQVFEPLLLPMVPSMSIFGVWLKLRPPGPGTSDWQDLRVHSERLAEIPEALFGTYVDPKELRLASEMGWAGLAACFLAGCLFLYQGRLRAPRRLVYWGVGITVLPILLGLSLLLGYLVLPMSIGEWWFVYPREVTAACFIALGAVPDLPVRPLLRLPILALVAVGVCRLALFNARQWQAFETGTADFQQIVQQIPQAPRLMYLVFDNSWRTKRMTPFVHLPAWVQAERGGWLSFHFASWNVFPIRYRTGGDIPPVRPSRWEWTPALFDMQRDGGWFDTFLIRQQRCPDDLFASDSSVRRVDHVGLWWLYRRGVP